MVSPLAAAQWPAYTITPAAPIVAAASARHGGLAGLRDQFGVGEARLIKCGARGGCRHLARTGRLGDEGGGFLAASGRLQLRGREVDLDDVRAAQGGFGERVGGLAVGTKETGIPDDRVVSPSYGTRGPRPRPSRH